MLDKEMGVGVEGGTGCCKGYWDEVWRVEVGIGR